MQPTTLANVDVIRQSPSWLVRQRDFSRLALLRVAAGVLCTLVARRTAKNIMPSAFVAAVPSYEKYGLVLWLWLHGIRRPLVVNPRCSRRLQSGFAADDVAHFKIAIMVMRGSDWLYDNNAYQAAFIQSHYPQARVVSPNLGESYQLAS